MTEGWCVLFDDRDNVMMKGWQVWCDDRGVLCDDRGSVMMKGWYVCYDDRGMLCVV